MKKSIHILLLIFTILIIEITFCTRVVYATEYTNIYHKYIDCSQSYWGDYGSPNGGAYQLGATHTTLDGYPGYYWSTARYIDTG